MTSNQKNNKHPAWFETKIPSTRKRRIVQAKCTNEVTMTTGKTPANNCRSVGFNCESLIQILCSREEQKEKRSGFLFFFSFFDRRGKTSWDKRITWSQASQCGAFVMKRLPRGAGEGEVLLSYSFILSMPPPSRFVVLRWREIFHADYFGNCSL